MFFSDDLPGISHLKKAGQSKNGQSQAISHGVAVLATGGQEHQPSEHLYGQHSEVITRKEFEKLLNSEPGKAQQFKRVALVQCVGTREPENLYCSRVRCTAAVKNSLKLKTIQAKAQISLLYRDIRTVGFKERYYIEARRQGIRFYRHSPDHKPHVHPYLK